MNFTKLDIFMDKMDERGFPMSELAASYDGEIVYRAMRGFSDYEKTKPVTNKDIYWIFSASKLITCAAAMRLVEEGRLSIHEPVSKYIPEFKNLTVVKKVDNEKILVPAENVMTVEHLFSMTAGLTYETKNLFDGNKTTLEVAKEIAKRPLSFEPGTHFCYSVCHDVLGAVIEIVSGKRFSDYLSEIIFTPLGMEDTGFHIPDEKRKRLSAMYGSRVGTAEAYPVPLFNPWSESGDFESGGAGIYSTVDDYMKFITALALGGTAKNGYRLLNSETVRLMGENHLPHDAINDIWPTRLYGYGFGLGCRAHMNPVYSCSPSSVGEFGWDGANGAYCLVDAPKKIAIYFGTHVTGASYVYNFMHGHLRNLVYEALEM